jgi:hypothetical protein
MIVLNMPQKSAEWIAARLWRLTASKMKSVITSTGGLSKSQAAMGAIDKMIAGITAAKILESNPDSVAVMDDKELQKWIANYTGDAFFGNSHTARGSDLEADAIAALSNLIGYQIDDAGMVIMGEDPRGFVACSPDGLIWQSDELIAGAEVKAPSLATFYGYVADGVLPSEYALQVHSSMAICEVDTWHFGAYFPNMPIFYVEVKRDDFTDKLHASLKEFSQIYADRLADITSKIKSLEVEMEVVL